MPAEIIQLRPVAIHSETSRVTTEDISRMRCFRDDLREEQRELVARFLNGVNKKQGKVV